MNVMEWENSSFIVFSWNPSPISILDNQLNLSRRDVVINTTQHVQKLEHLTGWYFHKDAEPAEHE